ncbi:MAG: RNA polymerase sigma factor [Polyangiaceae bacterium]|nr:RNA polymerase sigma factor [Polyangiaceae bacterium]
MTENARSPQDPLERTVLSPLTAEFRLIFESEFSSVCRSLRRLGVSESDLADVAQELFVTVYQHFSEYNRALPVRPWIYSFAVRFASNYRKLARHRGVGLDEVREQTAQATGNFETRDFVLRTLDQLDEDQRTAVVLHDMEEFTAPEIASLLSIPLNTVYSRVRLGREKFRAAATRLRGDP